MQFGQWTKIDVHPLGLDCEFLTFTTSSRVPWSRRSTRFTSYEVRPMGNLRGPTFWMSLEYASICYNCQIAHTHKVQQIFSIKKFWKRFSKFYFAFGFMTSCDIFIFLWNCSHWSSNAIFPVLKCMFNCQLIYLLFEQISLRLVSSSSHSRNFSELVTVLLLTLLKLSQIQIINLSTKYWISVSIFNKVI